MWTPQSPRPVHGAVCTAASVSSPSRRPAVAALGEASRSREGGPCTELCLKSSHVCAWHHKVADVRLSFTF